MIEIIKTSDGQSVVQYNGRATCSLLEPREEARRWVDRLELRQQVQVIFVLGGGSGFHLEELLLRYANLKVVAIEMHSVLCDHLQALVQNFAGRLSLICPMVRGQAPFEQIQTRFMLSPYQVVKFPPAVKLEQSSYDEIEKQLVARDLSSIKQILQFRGSRHPWLAQKLSASEGLLPNEKALTIKSLDLALMSVDAPSEEKSVWLALRELVK